METWPTGYRLICKLAHKGELGISVAHHLFLVRHLSRGVGGVIQQGQHHDRDFYPASHTSPPVAHTMYHTP
jgi:hypothetical protein